MGTVLAVKKALIAVSSCLQDHPPPDSWLMLSGKAKEIISNGASPSSMLLALFPNLGLLLPPLSSEHSVNNSSQESSLTNTNGIPSKDMKGKRQEVVFRLIYSNVAAGGMIGNNGYIVKALETVTGASIKFAVPVTADFVERVVTISAFEVSYKTLIGMHLHSHNIHVVINHGWVTFCRPSNHATLQHKMRSFLSLLELSRVTLRNGLY